MDLNFSISVLCTSLAALALGLIVLFSNKKSATNIMYFFISLVTFLWLYSLSFVYTTKNYQEAIFFGKIKYSSITFIPVFFYHFLTSFLGINKNRQRIILLFLYLVSLTYALLIWFGSSMINGLYEYGWGMYPKGGTLSLFFVACFILVFFYCLILLCLYYRQNSTIISRTRLLQIRWIFVSFFLSSFAIFDFLPYFGVNYKPLGYIPITLFLLAIAYAILRHKLLDIEVIVKKTLIFAGLFTIVYAIFAFFAVLGQIFFERFVTQNRWLSMIPSVIVITFTLRPLENFLINITDKYLFQKKYDYRELLRTFTSEVLMVLNIDRLIRLTEEKISEIMKLEYCRVIIGDNLAIDPEVTLKLPISAHGKSIGNLLLGKKKSDEGYNQDDLDILQPLVKTLGIAISNALLAEELSKAQLEAAQKDKMATIGTLAAGMAHEIRNPITTIRVFSEYVPDRLNDNDFRIKYRDVIDKEVGKIDHIIQALVDFSGEKGARQASGVSIHEAIKELISIISQSKDVVDRIKFINNVSPGCAGANINKEELDEIILNLTQNAIHAITGSGAITFTAEELDNNIILSISDTGCGMSEETAKHIFDPFFTTKSKGFGLGLFVVKELIDRNYGVISVKSIPKEGTIFTLKLQKIKP